MIYQRPGGRVAYRALFTIVGEEPGSPDGPLVVVAHVRHAASRLLTRKEIRNIEHGY
jgi:hypothetical protein